MAEHNTLEGSSLHEPKGLAALTGGSSDANKVYHSNGAGGGVWLPPTTTIDSASLSLGSVTLNATATTLAALDTWYPLAGTWVEESADGMTTTIASGKINVVTPGDYLFIGEVSCLASRNGKIANLSMMVDGVQVGPRVRRVISSTTDVGVLSFHCLVPNLVAAQEIQLCFSSMSAEPAPYTAGDTITAENAVLTSHLLRAT